MPALIDLTGQVFGRLTVLEKGEYRSRKRHWVVRCECGVTKEVSSIALRSGATKSCGCGQRELTSSRAKRHGMSKSTTHKSWSMMRSRCGNPNYTHYAYYGGAGITVCERWNNFENFLEDMGERPEGCTLDRIDSSKGYYPENCRWATRAEQVWNRGNNVIVSFNGKNMKLLEFSSLTGVTRQKAYTTLKPLLAANDGTPVTITKSLLDRMLSNQKVCWVTYQGQKMSANAFAKKIGGWSGTVWNALFKYGMTPDQVAEKYGRAA